MRPSGAKEKAVTSSSIFWRGLSRSWARACGKIQQARAKRISAQIRVRLRSWTGVRREVMGWDGSRIGMAAGFLSGRKFHYFDARAVGVVSIQAVFSIAAD